MEVIPDWEPKQRVSDVQHVGAGGLWQGRPYLTPIDDAALVREIRMGKTAAFQNLYERYAEPLYRFLWRRTPDHQTAEDMVQETFTRVWQKRASLDPGRSVKAFIFQVARNLAIDHLRHRTYQGVATPLEEDYPAEDLDPDRFAKRDQIRQAIATLSQHQRAVFCMSRFEGLKYAEIAAILQISVKTVEVHMGRALKKLREHLRDLAHLILLSLCV